MKLSSEESERLASNVRTALDCTVSEEDCQSQLLECDNLEAMNLGLQSSEALNMMHACMHGCNGGCDGCMDGVESAIHSSIPSC